MVRGWESKRRRSNYTRRKISRISPLSFSPLPENEGNYAVLWHHETASFSFKVSLPSDLLLAISILVNHITSWKCLGLTIDFRKAFGNYFIPENNFYSEIVFCNYVS